VTDQTSAHDQRNGYLPLGWKISKWKEKRVSAPKEVEKASRASMKIHVQATLDFWAQGIPTLDFGNNICQVAFEEVSLTHSVSPVLCSLIFAHCFVAA
jgi:urocanate hydratase